MLVSMRLLTQYVEFQVMLKELNCLTFPKDKKSIADNITQQARYAKALFIWTDCDREGEHIGAEVREAALKGNSRLDVKRAKFSNTEQAYVDINALLHKVFQLTDFQPRYHGGTQSNEPRRPSSQRCCRTDRARSPTWRMFYQIPDTQSAKPG